MRHKRELRHNHAHGTRGEGVDRDADRATSRMDHLQPMETRNWRDDQDRRDTCGGMKELKSFLLYDFESVPHAVKVRILRVPLEIAIDCLSGQLRREEYEIRD